ncbi:hypothetical protein CLOM_g10472 [Closterium sp. NIES-68]|nr:hypothetical protein CLOM_g10472 [Closterium sp. NIES-68]
MRAIARRGSRPRNSGGGLTPCSLVANGVLSEARCSKRGSARSEPRSSWGPLARSQPPRSSVPLTLCSFVAFLAACQHVATVAGVIIMITPDNSTYSFEDADAAFGGLISSTGMRGVLRRAVPYDACEELTNPAGRTGELEFVLIERGNCLFDIKVLNAQSAGYAAAVVYNNEPGKRIITMSGRHMWEIFIPAVFTTQSSGRALLHLIDRFPPPSASSPSSPFSSPPICVLLPTFDNAAWSVITASLVSLLSLSIVLASFLFIRRHRLRQAVAAAATAMGAAGAGRLLARQEPPGLSEEEVKALPELVFPPKSKPASVSGFSGGCSGAGCSSCGGKGFMGKGGGGNGGGVSGGEAVVAAAVAAAERGEAGGDRSAGGMATAQQQREESRPLSAVTISALQQQREEGQPLSAVTIAEMIPSGCVALSVLDGSEDGDSNSGDCISGDSNRDGTTAAAAAAAGAEGAGAAEAAGRAAEAAGQAAEAAGRAAGKERAMETCAICLEDYEWGDRLRILPCSHEFHVDCVDLWLTTRRPFCPVCKRDAHPNPPSNITATTTTTIPSSSSSSSSSSSAASASAAAAPTQLQPPTRFSTSLPSQTASLFLSNLLYPLVRSFSPLPSLPTAPNPTASNPSNRTSGNTRRTRPPRSSSSSPSSSSLSSSPSSFSPLPGPSSPTYPSTTLNPPSTSLSSFPPSATPPSSIPTLASSLFPSSHFIAASTASSSSLSSLDPSREPFLLHHPTMDSDDEEIGEIRPVPMPGFTPPSPSPSHIEVSD